MRFGWQILYFAVLLWVPGCSPPHTNPYDPESGQYLPPPPGEAPSPFFTRVRSVHTVGNVGVQAFSVAVDAWATGAETLDSVWVQYLDRPPVALRGFADGTWATNLGGSYFGDPRLGSVIGQPFHFTLRTDRDSTFIRGPLYLFRVIEASPQILEPDSNAITAPWPDLTWASFPASFPFHYRATVIQQVDLYHVDLIWDSTGISSAQRHVTVGDSLPDGSYDWYITVVDTFENWSHSIRGGFVVDAGSVP